MEKNRLKKITFYLNAFISLGSIFRLLLFKHLLIFHINQNIMVDAMHNGIFGEYATKEEFYISRATLMIFLTAFVALCFYHIFTMKKKESTARIFLLMATAINTIAGLYYLILMTLWALTNWVLFDLTIVLYISQILCGIIVCVRETFFHKNKEENHTKKWVPILIGCCLAAVMGVSMASPFYMLKEERESVGEVQRLVNNQPKEFDEYIGYQISNYCQGNAVYAENKLYIARSDNTTESTDIWTVDKQGNLVLFWDNPREKSTLTMALHYYDGYIYARTIWNEVIRISTADATHEILLTPNDTLTPAHFGIKDDQLLVSFYDTDYVYKIYTYPLTGTFSAENGVLYDTGLDGSYLKKLGFTNRYLYNNRTNTVLWFGDSDSPYASIENSVYYIDDGFLQKDTYVRNEHDTEITIDSYVWKYNIFDGKIFYIKGEKTYEAWVCDPDGENKEMIGTLPYGKYDSCYNLYMAEEYMVVYIKDRETKIDSAYLMWLDDGSYEKLW